MDSPTAEASAGRSGVLETVVRTVLPRAVTRTALLDSGTRSSYVVVSVCVTAPVDVSRRKLRLYVLPPPASDASSPISAADTAVSWTCWYTVFWQSSPRDCPVILRNVCTSTSQSLPFVIFASTEVPLSCEASRVSATEAETDLCT